MDGFVFAGAHKVFHLHLLKLARAKDEISGRHFVAKRFANLRYTERKFASAGGQHVKKVDEDALRRFRTQIDQRRRIIFGCRTDVRLKHQVERSWLGQVCRTAVWTLSLCRVCRHEAESCIRDNQPADR